MTIVENIENIDEIWDKLNMRLILQNKISVLENQNGLWSVTGAIATLLNIMSELSQLTKKSNLYYGGCFEQMISLLGNNRERKFISKCKTSSATKPEEWSRLVEFLKKEQDVRERLALLYKTKKCLVIEPKGKE